MHCKNAVSKSSTHYSNDAIEFDLLSLSYSQQKVFAQKCHSLLYCLGIVCETAFVCYYLPSTLAT